MIDLRLGDCLSVLRDLPAGSVQCCVTSPPYFGLRDYGVDGQIGVEETPEQYIDKLVQVFREVRRVLKDDGTVFLNLGDSYWGGKDENGSSKARATAEERGYTQSGGTVQMSKRPTDSKHAIYKPKDLLMIPARVALALQADGWYLRSEIIWHKPNPMPESVRDRPTKAHEMIYLLAKNQRYFYDAEAIREPAKISPETHPQGTRPIKHEKAVGPQDRGGHSQWERGVRHLYPPEGGRNRRDVWTVTTKPYKEAHFATFPPDLIEPCILAGTSERGECPKCGRAWVRVVEREAIVRPRPNSLTESRFVNRNGRRGAPNDCGGVNVTTLGWRPSCACVDESDHNGPFEPIPQTVLDPFNGSGTTGAVAVKHGRNYVGIELNPAYIELTQKRLQGTEMVMPLAEAAL